MSICSTSVGMWHLGRVTRTAIGEWVNVTHLEHWESIPGHKLGKGILQELSAKGPLNYNSSIASQTRVLHCQLNQPLCHH